MSLKHNKIKELNNLNALVKHAKFEVILYVGLKVFMELWQGTTNAAIETYY